MNTTHYTHKAADQVRFVDFSNEGSASQSGPIFDAVMAAVRDVDPVVLDPDCEAPHQLILVRYDKSDAARDFIYSYEAGAQWTTVITDIQYQAADAAGFCSPLWRSIFAIRLLANPERLISNVHSLMSTAGDSIKFGHTRKGCEFWLKFEIPARHVGVVPIRQDETRLFLRP